MLIYATYKINFNALMKTKCAKYDLLWRALQPTRSLIFTHTIFIQYMSLQTVFKHIIVLKVFLVPASYVFLGNKPWYEKISKFGHHPKYVIISIQFEILMYSMNVLQLIPNELSINWFFFNITTKFTWCSMNLCIFMNKIYVCNKTKYMSNLINNMIVLSVSNSFSLLNFYYRRITFSQGTFF